MTFHSNPLSDASATLFGPSDYPRISWRGSGKRRVPNCFPKQTALYLEWLKFADDALANEFVTTWPRYDIHQQIEKLQPERNELAARLTERVWRSASGCYLDRATPALAGRMAGTKPRHAWRAGERSHRLTILKSFHSGLPRTALPRCAARWHRAACAPVSKFLADQPVYGIAGAATQRDGKQQNAQQKDVLIPATADRKAFGHVYHNECNEHLDGQRRSEEPRD
jgi:hypothetical protein